MLLNCHKKWFILAGMGIEDWELHVVKHSQMNKLRLQIVIHVLRKRKIKQQLFVQLHMIYTSTDCSVDLIAAAITIIVFFPGSRKYSDSLLAG